MKFKIAPHAITKKLSNHSFKLFGLDEISLTKIKRRSDMIEIGTSYGGWVIPANILDEKSICYCIGCGEDISFDIELIKIFGCDVYAFDPTPRAINYVQNIAGDNNKYHFFDLGLWDREDILKFYTPQNPEHVSHSLLNLQKTDEYILVKVNRLSNIMKSIGHDRIDILKIDIEGAEYKVIESIIADNVDVKVICIEYDECFSPLDNQYKERIRASINSLLSNGYSLAYVQGRGNYTFVKDS